MPRLPPTILGERSSRSSMGKYECVICGYVYDPELGDPDGGVTSGTPFTKIPDDWVCPVCGADKSEFQKMEE